jgi:hypothetical protein
MPLYNLACREPLDEATRERVARAVTQAHCEVTGAPAEFVNVLFVHGYPLHGALTVDALGGVRKGGNRTADVVERLRLALRDAIARSAGIAPAQVNVTLIGIPSNWVMEGGRVMPEPGTESQWLAQRDAGA